MKDLLVLDACALIAYLNEEPGADVVEEVFTKASTNEVNIIMNKLNLLEVYYDVYRKCGKESAISLLETVADISIQMKAGLSNAVFAEAGRLKASYRISIADSIALAEASVSGGFLLTSDHHEFDVIEKSENIKFRWIR